MPYEIKVYKIWYYDAPKDIYIGSTKQDALYKRMRQHRASAKTKDSKIYKLMREKGNNFKYILLEAVQVSCKDGQLKAEQKWMDNLKPTLNTYRAIVNKPQNINIYEKFEKRKKEQEHRENEFNKSAEGIEYNKLRNYNIEHNLPTRFDDF
tara:strand:+ start:70 stop:522 length:453 start_codon:yes stop_codon:yes gene_type:complete